MALALQFVLRSRSTGVPYQVFLMLPYVLTLGVLVVGGSPPESDCRLRNVFVLYMPPGNAEAMVHYQDTIVNRVSLERLKPFVQGNLLAKLISIFKNTPIAVWGSRAGSKNRSNFERMNTGDDVLIIEGKTVRLIGKIAAKVQSIPLSNELWKPLSKTNAEPWELIYFIANARELHVPFSEFCRLFGYSKDYQLRGFTTVSEDKLESFYQKYDDLYSILVRLENGEPVLQRSEVQKIVTPDEDLVQVAPDLVEGVLQDALVSDHVKMQWKLARLGLKAGENVWVPAGDQTKLRKAYNFDGFDSEFAAGIDLPHSYMENIDVVWKKEYQIAAAYEIENSTSIYSGLLRFADLNILAPNTIYPMFVVAPADRKNRLREQLRRPTFKRLGLDQKVKFLSYESIDAIDTFFADSSSGLTIDTIIGKAELVA